MKRRHSSSSRHSSPIDKRARDECYDPDEVWEVDDGPEPFIDLTDIPSIPPAALGYRRQFALWTPDHVVLESSDGHKLSISKAALSHSSTFFKDMLGNPNPSGPFAPIPTLIPVEDLYIFLWVVRDQDNWPKIYQIDHEGEEVHLSAVIYHLSFKNCLQLTNVADRFDCEAIGISTKLSLEIYYASLKAWELLKAASDLNSIPIAKRAIIKMPDSTELPIYHLSDWWNMISSLRPTWQIELTKLVWVFRNELIHRPVHELLNLRRKGCFREPIMLETTDSWEEVADAFNPGSEDE